ncbi:MAG: CatA-like O-acetyltransferase, family 2 [Parabacteroides sp.]|nr:CatA-like O-acetyltransferase, family 2 [Parabacteroides sp.]
MKEVNPKETTRASAFEMWMNSPMPMVTLTKTFDITRLYKMSKKKRIKLNMLLCWCIGKAASQVEEFYTLPINDKLFKYDKLAINVIVNNKEGGINSCDIHYTNDLMQFGKDYTVLTNSVADSCQSIFEEDSMIVGTSAMIATELDSIVNQYTEKFLNPMVMWGKYRKKWFKITLPISFQFHHVQMDGGHAAQFLDYLQKEIDNL